MPWRVWRSLCPFLPSSLSSSGARTFGVDPGTPGTFQVIFWGENLHIPLGIPKAKWILELLGFLHGLGLFSLFLCLRLCLWRSSEKEKSQNISNDDPFPAPPCRNQWKEWRSAGVDSWEGGGSMTPHLSPIKIWDNWISYKWRHKSGNSSTRSGSPLLRGHLGLGKPAWNWWETQRGLPHTLSNFP